MADIALALGFKTSTKGWDIIKKIDIPSGWRIVINSSKSYYNTENYDEKWHEVYKRILIKIILLTCNEGFLAKKNFLCYSMLPIYNITI